MYPALPLELAQQACAPSLLAAGTPVAPLDPHRLDDQAVAAIAVFQTAGESENTRRGYRQALRYWLAWFQIRYGRALQLPVHVATVAQFIVDHAETAPGAGDQQLPAAHDERLVAARIKANRGPLALATIEHRLAALARAHRDHDQPSPVEEAHVRRLLGESSKKSRKRAAEPWPRWTFVGSGSQRDDPSSLHYHQRLDFTHGKTYRIWSHLSRGRPRFGRSRTRPPSADQGRGHPGATRPRSIHPRTESGGQGSESPVPGGSPG
ncbi:MAG: putative integrase [Ramlibacter sp.]|nr:putative integrase [Ramlibacter sp.]